MRIGLLVCDEAHKLKNTGTSLYKALYPLSAPMRIMVTGQKPRTHRGDPSSAPTRC